MHFINIGFGNMVRGEGIICMIGPDSAPAKRYIHDARESSMLIDATCGRRTKGVIFMEDGRVVLSALLPETIAGRLKSQRTGDES